MCLEVFDICFGGSPGPRYHTGLHLSLESRVDVVSGLPPAESFPEVLASACRVHNSCVGVLLLDPPGRGAKFAANVCHYFQLGTFLEGHGIFETKGMPPEI